MKRWIPWYAKIATKLLLSRLPVSYAVWRKLNIFAHGYMHRPDYAFDVFRQHFDHSEFPFKKEGFVALELGPGDSLLSAVIAKAHGAKGTYLIDTGAYATDSLEPYRSMARHLSSVQLKPPDLRDVSNVTDVLQVCNAIYGTRGLESLREIPESSVDFIWSHAVLEHIRRHEFLDTLKELHRVLKPEGIASHRIDLRDHLGGALNNLRFSMYIWESDWMAHSGFYTNRLRYSEMLKLFADSEFDVTVTRVERWETLPTPRKRMASEFRATDTHDLLVSGFDAILKPRKLAEYTLAQ